MIKFKLAKIDPNFAKILDDSALQRRLNQVDNKDRSYRELTKMMTNCPSFPKVKQELSILPRKEDLLKLRGRKNG
jgi:hypothetical protein